MMRLSKKGSKKNINWSREKITLNNVINKSTTLDN